MKDTSTIVADYLNYLTYPGVFPAQIFGYLLLAANISLPTY